MLFIKSNRPIVAFFLFCIALAKPVWAEQCYHPGSWFIPDKKQYIDEPQAIEQLNASKLILLGEHHGNEQHHQWHQSVIEQLTINDNRWQIGLEVFPRSRQKILDRWINKEIDEADFIKQLEWDEAWSFPYEYYRPIFLLAREKSLPLIALNVDRSLIRKTGKLGWENIPTEEREGISDPAAPSRAYIKRLAISFQRHNTQPIGDTQKQQFRRFIQQQLLWDRAMAEGIDEARKKHPDRRMISIIGSWHLIAKEGVPSQLEALNNPDYFIAIPWDDHLMCDEVSDHFADVLYSP
ncbi:MAG: ChaN family lipoprotein [Gammaproteobacteria bacterium]|nr:ChaN family lipoprotein [Gammaproteobacteria bacterium]